METTISYTGPMLIREPELRWPIVVLAALITALIALFTASLHYLVMTRPHVHHQRPTLERSLRAGDQEFEQFRNQIAIENLVGNEKLHPLNNLVVEITAAVRNDTGRTINGLEMRGAVLDSQGLTVGERNVVVVPARQTALEPGEAINVRILIESVSRDSERGHPNIDIAGLRFD